MGLVRSHLDVNFSIRMKRKEILKRFSSWYFSKNVLPYWAILLVDTFIVLASAIFTYWVTNRTLITFEQRFSVLYTALQFSLLSWIGAWCFKTY